MSEEPHGLWDWALVAYARPGVQDQCLICQDAHGQNVPLLLWAAWRAATGRPLDVELVEAAVDTARAWEEAAVLGLRALRRTLKKPVPDLDDAAREAVRAEIKRVELLAERKLLEGLEALDAAPAGPPRPIAPALVEVAKAWARVVPRADLERLAGVL